MPRTCNTAEVPEARVVIVESGHDVALRRDAIAINRHRALGR
jgi:hypothetical protein